MNVWHDDEEQRKSSGYGMSFGSERCGDMKGSDIFILV